MAWNHQSRTGHRGAHCVKPRCYSSNLTESTNCRRRDRNVKQAWDRQPAASLASHVAASALRELVSFQTAEHIRDEIRRIDRSVHHHHISTPGYQLAHQIWIAYSFIDSKDMIGAQKSKKTGHLTLTTPIRGSLSSQEQHLLWPICTPNLRTYGEVYGYRKVRQCYLKLDSPALTLCVQMPVLIFVHDGHIQTILWSQYCVHVRFTNFVSCIS